MASKNTHESSIVGGNRPENDKPEHSHAGLVFDPGVFTQPRPFRDGRDLDGECLLWRRKETFRPTVLNGSYVPGGDAGWMEPLLPIGAHSRPSLHLKFRVSLSPSTSFMDLVHALLAG